ncbi:MAG TPA: three-Cys-motif partner protein TcmP [Polyangiaceae bacterium]|nr:three-Cys-motif partner protein TcmP [Polyangiaceae bacterium]
MQVPREYQGREQSFLKHRVLHEYLLGWGLKLGSLARRRRVRLCYADGFAGPWKAQSAALEDTSIVIGLNALEAAAQTWREHGAQIDVEAAFVEKDDMAFGDLDLRRRLACCRRARGRTHRGRKCLAIAIGQAIGAHATGHSRP